MSIYQCPKGHESTESDFCSECGAKIYGAPELEIASPSLSIAPPTVVPTVEYCPDCTAPHEIGSGNFCEICGYNFTTGVHGEVPPAIATLTSGVETAKQATFNSAETPTHNFSSSAPPNGTEVDIISWQVIVTVDPSLRDESSPEPPTIAAIAIQLNQESNLIGRRNERRGIYPEIALDFDDAVSHRHAVLNRRPDGSFMLRDIGSTNGTKLNGVELKPLFDVPLEAGDEITLGHWTRIALECN